MVAHLKVDLRNPDGQTQQPISATLLPILKDHSVTCGTETSPVTKGSTTESLSEANYARMNVEQPSWPFDNAERFSMAEGFMPSPSHNFIARWCPNDRLEGDVPYLTEDVSIDHLPFNCWSESAEPPLSQSPNEPIDASNSDTSLASRRPTTGCERNQRARDSLPLQLVHLDSELVEAYFSIVCPIFSTFDSEQNQFRSFVVQRWQSSVSIYYAILSMTAAKLAWQTPGIRVHALRYQSMALKTLYADLSSSTSLNTELLFVVLLLGLTTCWHDISDLGTVHLRALQHAIATDQILPTEDPQTLGFFKEAMVYWEMVACLVDDNVPIHDYSNIGTASPLHAQLRSRGLSPAPGARIQPHPWAGVAAAPQALFSRIVRHVRSLRSFNLGGPTLSCTVSQPQQYLQTLYALEEEVWTLQLPKLHEIANTGDENTPAIHHLLLAEAYTFANLYQLYYIFPNLRRKRAQHIRVGAHLNLSPDRSWAQSQASLWSRLLQEDSGGSEEWLNFLGRSVINRLEQMQINSGTSCVQGLLLLVGSASLSVRPDLEGSDTEREIMQTREFVSNRLSSLSNKLRSVPLRCVRLVVSEIFKQLDVGVNVFWMDVLQSMGVVTIIG